MSNTNTKAKSASEAKPAADVTKEFEVLMTANQKTLQDAFVSGAEAAEKAFKTGSEAFKTTYEKAIKDGKSHVEKATQTLSEASFYDKEGAEPFLKVGNAAVEKSEKFGAEVIEFSSNSVAEYFSVARSVIEADDVQKAIELQSDYARSSVETYIAEAGKLNTMIMDATKTIFEPLGAQYAANMGKMMNRG